MAFLKNPRAFAGGRWQSIAGIGFHIPVSGILVSRADSLEAAALNAVCPDRSHQALVGLLQCSAKTAKSCVHVS